MKNYDFHRQLSDLEFQDFARDMIQVREGIVFESFRETRDEGIDSRYIAQDGKYTVLQAKRWQDYGPLYWSELEKEKKKMDRIRPDRYILALSREVSPEDKRRLMKLFAPYLISERDVVTARDLNNWLDQDGFARVEEKYYRLWIASAQVLRKTVQDAANQELLAESGLEWEKARKGAELFVETAVFGEAQRMLARYHTVILSGEPGVGKTTLANQLAVYWICRKGFDTYLWANSVGDLYKAKQMPGKKAVVYDDFWGSNFLDPASSGREERRLARLIEQMETDYNCVLILTSREYVLEQGIRRNEELRAVLERFRLECRLKAYSRTQRAQIYLGRLRRMPLTWEQMKELFAVQGLVVDSDFFNPRLIQMYLESVTEGLPARECAHKLLEYLRKPENFWQQILQNLSEEARIFFMILELMPVPVNLDAARICYLKAMEKQYGGRLYREMDRVIAELERTVVLTELMPQTDVVRVGFQNPSARDFMRRYLLENLPQYQELLLESCCYFESCVELLRLCIQAGADAAFYERALGHAIEKADHTFFNYPRDFYSLCRLLSVYRGGAGGAHRDWFVKEFGKLMDWLENDAEDLSIEDLQEFPEAADRALRCGIREDAETLAGVWLEAMMRNRLEITPESLPGALAAAGKVWAYKNRERMWAYLEFYYRGELCLAAVKNEVFYFDDLRDDMSRMEEWLGMTFSEELQNRSAQYAS